MHWAVWRLESHRSSRHGLSALVKPFIKDIRGWSEGTLNGPLKCHFFLFVKGVCRAAARMAVTALMASAPSEAGYGCIFIVTKSVLEGLSSCFTETYVA